VPTITRWFRVTHDINSHPEIWELRELHGDRAALIWLECLSIADRNQGLVGPDSPHLHAVLASKCRVYSPKVRSILTWCLGKGWLQVRPILTPQFGTSSSAIHDGLWIAKWQKYNKRRESDESLSETTPRPTRHDNKIIHPIPKQWGDPEVLIEKYNKETPNVLPAVEKITPARIKKARDYLKIFPDEEFWTEAFKEIAKSPFLLGLKKNPGHETFKANFDWLLTKGKDGTENVVKLYEGRYSNGK